MQVYVMVSKGRKHTEKKRRSTEANAAERSRRLAGGKASIGFRNMRRSLQEPCWWSCQVRNWIGEVEEGVPEVRERRQLV